MLTLRFFHDQFSIRFLKRPVLYSFMLCLLLLFTLVVGSMNGSYALTLHDTIYTFLGEIHKVVDSQAELIIWEFRLPRSFVAILSGALFALSGALLQNMTRNPLADPSLVGISQGAALAVVLLTVVQPESIDAWREVVAFVGAISIAIIIQLLRGKEGHPLKFILLGVGVAAFVSAVISTLLTYSELQSTMSALAWLAGSTHITNWGDVHVLAAALTVISVIALYQARTMSAISLGSEVAVGLGVSIKRTMMLQLSLSVGAAAIATAVVGPLGFIGLLAPHIARKMVHSGPANHLILTALVGAILVLVADTLGKTLFLPAQLAAGLVTSLVGAPLFAYLLIRK